MLKAVIDLYSNESTNEIFCVVFHVQQTSNTDMFNFEKITGLACKSNRTLSFLSMDSLNYGLVAEKLGVSVRHAVQSTAAIIIDSQVSNLCITSTDDNRNYKTVF